MRGLRIGLVEAGRHAAARAERASGGLRGRLTGLEVPVTDLILSKGSNFCYNKTFLGPKQNIIKTC